LYSVAQKLLQAGEVVIDNLKMPVTKLRYSSPEISRSETENYEKYSNAASGLFLYVHNIEEDMADDLIKIISKSKSGYGNIESHWWAYETLKIRFRSQKGWLYLILYLISCICVLNK